MLSYRVDLLVGLCLTLVSLYLESMYTSYGTVCKTANGNGAPWL